MSGPNNLTETSRGMTPDCSSNTCYGTPRLRTGTRPWPTTSRYVEDQFVEWEPVGNEITPGVREQYVCYAIIDWHCAHYVRVCLDFHAKTKNNVWLKKARALADTLTAIQHPNGFYPTWMNHKPSKAVPGALTDINYHDVWPNCSSYTGEMLLRLGEYLQGAAGK